MILDLGRRVRPHLTPADPDAFLADVRARTNIGVTEEERHGPLI